MEQKHKPCKPTQCQYPQAETLLSTGAEARFRAPVALSLMRKFRSKEGENQSTLTYNCQFEIAVAHSLKWTFDAQSSANSAFISRGVGNLTAS